MLTSLQMTTVLHKQSHPELTLRTAHPLQQDIVAVSQDTLNHYFELLE